MDRLTKRIGGVVVYTCGKYEDTTPGEMESWDVRDVITRLAEYEDTGLIPEEIKEHEEIFAAYRHVCGGRPPEEVKRALKLLDETNGCIKIHYDGAEYTIKQLCDRLRRAEKASESQSSTGNERR